jgi:predicted HTH transcriptional regulator
MGFKEKMMGKMSAEEKSDMMEKMMDQFFGNMTVEEKQEMMNNMMPKMMGQMMGGGSFMSRMMQDHDGNGESPMSMCHKMMSNISRSNELATYATPEIRGLFEEWIAQLDAEVLDFVKQTQSTNPEKLAEHLKLSKDSAIYLLSRLAQRGKVSMELKYQADL